MICPDRSFYNRSTKIVARELLGKKLVRIISGSRIAKRLSVMIVEAEAYGFSDDSASHAFGGITRRNYVMFGEAGRAYIYYSYGRHFCVNVSARSPEIQAGAVLIRALQPLEGLAFMKNHRNNSKDLLLTSGPGRLSQALSISPSLNGIDMTDSSSGLHIEFGVAPQGIKSTPRIGTSKAPYKMWRFILPTESDSGNLTKFASRRWRNLYYKQIGLLSDMDLHSQIVRN